MSLWSRTNVGQARGVRRRWWTDHSSQSLREKDHHHRSASSSSSSSSSTTTKIACRCINSSGHHAQNARFAGFRSAKTISEIVNRVSACCNCMSSPRWPVADSRAHSTWRRCREMAQTIYPLPQRSNLMDRISSVPSRCESRTMHEELMISVYVCNRRSPLPDTLTRSKPFCPNRPLSPSYRSI